MQLRAHDRSAFVQSLDSILEAVRSAATDADLVVLPEGTVPGYVLGVHPLEEGLVDAALDRLCAIARESAAVIVVGVAATVDASARNAAVVIDADGSLAGRAEKLFLWHFDRRWYSPGQRLEPVRTSLGTLGVLVCADGRLPTIARALVDRGAQILVMPTAWVTSGRDPDTLENIQADLLGRVRAYENGVPFVAANKCGAELGMVAYCGKSQIVDARGEIIAIAPAHDAATLLATIHLEEPHAPRAIANETLECVPALAGAIRLAISYDPLPSDVEARLELLDDDYAISPHSQCAADESSLPMARVSDELMLDPAGLLAYRRALYALIAWETALGAPWSERIARARALELRLYVVVFDRSIRRAFAVDPDGMVVAGTFDGYQLASFALEPRKTAETLVAPGSDVIEGLDRVAKIQDDARG